MEKHGKGISIYVQAAVAMMLVLFVHYLVRALPGALGYGGPAAILVPTLTTLLFVGIGLVLLNKKVGRNRRRQGRHPGDHAVDLDERVAHDHGFRQQQNVPARHRPAVGPEQQQRSADHQRGAVAQPGAEARVGRRIDVHESHEEARRQHLDGHDRVGNDPPPISHP